MPTCVLNTLNMINILKIVILPGEKDYQDIRPLFPADVMQYGTAIMTSFYHTALFDEFTFDTI